MSRPIKALVSRRAIAHNIAIVRKAAPHSKVWAVLKADAYGHGLIHLLTDSSPALVRADGIAILETATAETLRELGWRLPVLLLEGCFDPADLDLAARLGVTVTVHHDEQIAMIEAARIDRPIDVYLKMNTGMNRLGFSSARYRQAHERLVATSKVGTITLMTHFANADRPEGVTEQLAAFERGTGGLTGPRSLANSAAILAHPETQADWVRPGIVLYGASPFATRTAADFGLLPAMELHSELIAVQHLQTGDVVGYGHRYSAEREMRVGIVACGYADGYPRVAPTGTPITVDGVRARTIGRVSMDMLTVDLTNAPHATVGSAVELWGAQLPVDEVAQAAGTNCYELLCALAPRVPVITVD
ncbi:MAG: alanine racemase [Burkholderiaceae bacterium]